ncbi:MAG: ATP-binding protein [Myxococcales bacterium]|nr:ATP-binding protein [Myxococcales bacterium]
MERIDEIWDTLRGPVPSIEYELSKQVAARWPKAAIVETTDWDFDVDTFVQREEGCRVEVHSVPHPQFSVTWLGPERGVGTSFEQGHRTLVWADQTFEIVDVSWCLPGGDCRRRRFFVGPSEEVVTRLVHRVAMVSQEVQDEVMVFANGFWQRSTELRDAIRDATFDNLVLPPGMAESLLSSFRQFLASEEEYATYGVPWKRGVLFLGPPGNGKTHCIKALINALELPCLYVQSFESTYGSPQQNVQQVFERARRTTPCALVLEDLDSLLNDKTRAFFLNELDGFASNRGILTLATTNHPDKLDPAIVDRPSRFDRKVPFTLPAQAERATYLQLWVGNLPPGAEVGGADVEHLARATEGFSYAYVKELMLSSLMRWMSDGRTQRLADVAASQVAVLREQMAGAAEVRIPVVPEDSD